jgi:WD40 repeat protein
VCVCLCLCVCVCVFDASGAQAVDFSGGSPGWWSGKGSLLASVGGDRICRIWDVETATTLRLLKSTGALITVQFSPCGNFVAAGGLRGALGLWDVQNGKLLAGRPHPVLLNLEASVSSITWTPDSRALVVCCSDGVCWSWDVVVGRLLAARCMTTGNHCHQDVTSCSSVFFPPRFLQAAMQKAAEAARLALPVGHRCAIDEDASRAQPSSINSNSSVKTPTSRFLSGHRAIESRTPRTARGEDKAGLAPRSPGSPLASPIVVCADNKGCVHILHAEGLEASPSGFSFDGGAHMHFQTHHPSHLVQTLNDSTQTQALILMMKDVDLASFLNQVKQQQ